MNRCTAPGSMLTRRQMLSGVAVCGGVLISGKSLPSKPSVAAPSTATVSVRASFEHAGREFLRFDKALALTYGLVCPDGHLVGALGYTDLASRREVSPSHLFAIGSLSKSFVALLVLQLVEAGQVSLQRSIFSYLPWLPVVADHGDISVHDLLSHSSGLPRDGYIESTCLERPIRQGFAPGKTYYYSNLGYAILGRLIESVAGVSFSTVLRSRILGPLGMTATEPVIDSSIRSRLVDSYVPLHDDRPYPPGGALSSAGNFVWTDPAGSIASTSLDMTRYLQMLLRGGRGPAGSLISSESFLLMTSAHATVDVTSSYGYGIGMDQLDGHKRLRHAGALPSFASSMQLDLEAGNAVFTATNARLGQGTSPLTEFGLRLLRSRSEHRSAPKAVFDDTKTNYTGYAGTYLAADRRVVEVRETREGLKVLSQGRLTTMHPLEGDSFVAQCDEFKLFPLLFVRGTRTAASAVSTRGAVVALCYGRECFTRKGSVTDEFVGLRPELVALEGTYCSYDPNYGTLRVIQRSGSLWINGAERLERIGAAVFRSAGVSDSPEFIEFHCFIDGRAQILRQAGGAELRRVA